MKRISTLIIGIFLAFFVMVGIGLLIFNRTSTGWKALNVMTGSMQSSIPAGSMVFVHRVPESTLKSGDVITYINPKNARETITHRIVAETKNENAVRSFVTKGDNNPNPDQPILAGRVVGKVVLSVPLLGRATMWTLTPLGLLFIIYLPAFMVVVSEIRHLAAYYRTQHYTLPEFLARKTRSKTGYNFAIVSILFITTLVITLPARAAVINTATLTDNIISTEENGHPNDGEGKVSIRRAFIRCTVVDEEPAQAVDIILYNKAKTSVDISGWTIKSGDEILLTIPDGTVMERRSLFQTSAPILENITYPEGHLVLYDTDDEQIHQLNWFPYTRGNRICRISD